MGYLVRRGTGWRLALMGRGAGKVLGVSAAGRPGSISRVRWVTE
jgi:hypothetical protein